MHASCRWHPPYLLGSTPEMCPTNEPRLVGDAMPPEDPCFPLSGREQAHGTYRAFSLHSGGQQAGG